MSTAVIDNVQIFKRKQTEDEGIVFTGTNSKQVATWLREKGYGARAGGKYVLVKGTNGDHKLLKGNIVVLEEQNDGAVHIVIHLTAEDFKRKYIVGKKNEIL